MVLSETWIVAEPPDSIPKATCTSHSTVYSRMRRTTDIMICSIPVVPVPYPAVKKNFTVVPSSTTGYGQTLRTLDTQHPAHSLQPTVSECPAVGESLVRIARLKTGDSHQQAQFLLQRNFSLYRSSRRVCHFSCRSTCTRRKGLQKISSNQLLS